MSSVAGALTRDISVLKPERLLFTMHYKRIVAPLLIGAGLLYVPMLIALKTLQHLGRVRVTEVDQILNRSPLVMVLVATLPVGTAAFSRAFKEQNVLFFHALPISRSRQWFVLVASSFSAVLTCAIAFLVIRPAAFAFDGSGWAIAAILVLLLFSAGTAFSLAAVRPAEVYLGGFGATWFLLVGALWEGAAPGVIFARPLAPLRSASEGVVASLANTESLEIPRAYLPAMAACFIVMFLLASHWFYVKGELTLARNRLRNPLIVIGLGLMIDLIAGPALLHAMAVRRPFAQLEIAMSPDSRYVATHYARSGASWLAKVQVIDIASDKRVATIETNGLTDYWFMGDTLATVRRDLSLFRRIPLIPARDLVELRTVDGRLLRRITLDGETVADTRRISPTDVVLGLRNGDAVRIVIVNQSGAMRELAHANGVASIFLGAGTAYARRDTGRSHVWRVGPQGAQELPWSGAAERENPTIVHGVVYASDDLAFRAIEKNNPVPRKEGETFRYQFAERALVDNQRIFAIVANPTTHRASLWAEQPRGWRLLASDLFMGNTVQWFIEDLALSPGAGIVAYARRNGSQCTIRVYDGQEHDVMTVQDPQAEIHPSVWNIGKGQYLVSVRHQPANKIGAASTVAEFVFRDGKLQQIDARAGGHLLRLLPDGTQVRQLSWSTLLVVPPAGPARKIAL